MNSDDDNKRVQDEQEKKLKKKIDKLQVCPYCQSLVEFIWVHSHYQCPNCKNVVTSCCGDS